MTEPHPLQVVMRVGRDSAKAERAAIVKWLRGLQGAERMMMPLTIADAIERGDHLK